MKTCFSGFKLAGVAAALLAVTGCGDDDGSTHRIPVIDNSNDNQSIWFEAMGNWAQPGSGRAITIGDGDIKLYEYNQTACLEIDSFDFEQGQADYSMIERSEQELLLQSTEQDKAEKYQQHPLATSCETPLSPDSINAKVTFDYVWQTLNDYYAHFAARNIDWQQVYAQYAPAINADSSDEQLQQILAKMIAGLNDANVMLDTGQVQLTGHKTVPLKQAAKAIAANALAYGEDLTEAQALEQLKSGYLAIQKSYVTESSWQQWPTQSQTPSIAWGLSDDNVGLLILNDLNSYAQTNADDAAASDAQHVQTAKEQLALAATALSTTDGLIIDLRDASGGNEDIAQAVIEMFAATTSDTYSAQLKNAQLHSDEIALYQVQGNEMAYQKPVYLVVSQGTVGAAEKLAIALKSQNHVKIVGEATAGALSNPITLKLPNGWHLSLPNTVVTEPGGDMVSVEGIKPDITAAAYTQTSTRELKFESYQRALSDMGKFQHAHVAVETYEAQMQQLMSAGLIPGAAVAVVKGGEIVYSRGFGRADENGREVTADTPFFIASVSKTLLGTTIAQVEAQGLIALSDIVEGSGNALGFDISYPQQPEFKPTFAHLVTHTSGLVDDNITGLCTYYFADDHSSVANWFLGQPVCPDSINPSMGEHLHQYLTADGETYKTSNFTSSYGPSAGSVNRYSNYGAALAGYALEAKTGKSLVELTNQYVINPLGMDNTRWSIEGIPLDTARRYIVGGDGVAVPLRDYLSVTYPDGGAISTANDLAKLAAAAMKGGVYQNQQRLAANGVSRMLSSQSDVPTTERGVGYFWRLDGDYFFHNGGDFGVLADLWADTHHDVAVVLLTNGDVLHSPAIGSMIQMFAASKAFAYGYGE